MGKTGIVARVYSDGDLRVNVEGKTWTFNPLCVSLAPRSAEYNNTMRANERQDHSAESAVPSAGECILVYVYVLYPLCYRNCLFVY